MLERSQHKGQEHKFAQKTMFLIHKFAGPEEARIMGNSRREESDE
jgi:hypothetical protein